MCLAQIITDTHLQVAFRPLPAFGGQTQGWWLQEDITKIWSKNMFLRLWTFFRFFEKYYSGERSKWLNKFANLFQILNLCALPWLVYIST